ncbi:MAG: hypothetical protein JSV86_05575 [Gemmatimonadota bacterium]|nr:MAG: hypothetical protein JSV86_05575 [Gemmatimonadota bacterium]
MDPWEHDSNERLWSKPSPAKPSKPKGETWPAVSDGGSRTSISDKAVQDTLRLIDAQRRARELAKLERQRRREGGRD